MKKPYMNVQKDAWLLFVCLLLYCFFPVSGHANDAETRLQNITVVSDDNYPPYIFRDSNGVTQGILVDEWKIWEKKTGIKVNLIAMDWSKAQEFLLRGNADVIDTLFFSEERAKQYDFTKPYAAIDVPVFFHKNLGGIIDIASLQGFTIGVKAGDACIEVLRKQGITSFKEYNSYEMVVNAAIDGEIKVFSIDKPPALYYLYKMNFEDEFRYSFNLYTGEFHRAVKKGRTDILKIVEDGFALINRKEHDDIEKKWMGEPFSRPAYLRYVLFAFLLAGTIFLVLVFFNITLRRKVRSKTSELQDLVNQLLESEKRFRDLAEMLPEAVFETNANMNLTYTNQQSFSLFGYSKEDFEKGLNALDMLVPEDRKRATENIAKRFQGKEWGMNEYRALKKNGSTLPVLLHTSPIIHQGAVEGLRGIIIDITEQKQAERERFRLEAQLLQAQKMESIGTLAGGIAHDFNNILFPMMGFAEMALDDLSKDSPLRNNIEEILQGTKRASELVKQILTFSRQSDQKPKPIKVQFIVKEALTLIRSTIPTTIEIKQYISNECGLVMADPTQIHQIAMNLLTNAYHAMENEGGKLEVTLRNLEFGLENADLKNEESRSKIGLSPGTYVCLTVADTGSGIGQEEINRIFDPYYTTKEKGKGTGLGLAVVHGIVKSYGGDIGVYSEPGKGTTFSVYLPVIKFGVEKEEIAVIAPVLTGSERILIVDDEQTIVRMEKQMLERLGYDVTERTSSVEALEAFRDSPDKFDLVITDMTMPNMTGIQLSQKLLEIRPDIPIIICTGFSEKINEEKAKAIGIQGYAMKPVVKSELAKKIRAVLDSK